jgi:hypothetical protein
MGLHHTAHYLRSKGRGNDTMLVHMTPSEVKGLQAIAMRHGGSLTINPDTGLPEAGFLEQILPIVAAAGLTYLTAGAAAPTLTAALGGSTMAGGIAAGALSGAAISGGMAAIQGKDAGKAALMGGLGGALSGGLGAYDAANVFNAPNLLADTAQTMATSTPEVATEIAKQGTQQAVTETGKQAATQAFPTVNQAGNALAIPNPSVPGGFISSETGQALASAPSGSGFTAGEMMAGSNFAPGTLPGGTGTAAEAAKTIGSTGNVTGPVTPSYYSGLGPDNYIQKAGIQALPVLGLMQDEQQQLGPQEEKSKLRRLSPDFRAYEPPRPNPYYQAQYAAQGGIMQSYQAGGPVERMSMANTAMNPQGGLYPMGMIDKTQYAVPTQRPVSSEMVMDTPAYERSNPMLMAGGGQIKGYAAGGVPDFGNGYNPFANLPAMSGPLGAAGQQTTPFSPFNHAVDPNRNFTTTRDDIMGGDRRVNPLSFSEIIANGGGLQLAINQPTGQSTFPGAASMQGGFGQGASGYPSFTMGSGGGGGGGPFPLEGQYGIVRMNTGGATKLPKGDPGLYRDADPTTRSQDSFTAALTRLNACKRRPILRVYPD